nr:glycosyltransferase family 2 protein [Algoriphagus sp. Y33]
MTRLVSILIPNFNKAPYLQECLESVLAQTYKNWECIIVDDSSTDDSWEIINDFLALDSRFQIFKRPGHLPKGGNVCRNFALEKSKGDFIFFLDSDDVLALYCLSQRMEHVYKNLNLDFWAFPTALFEKKVSDAQFLWNIDELGESDLSRFLRMDALWQTSGAIYKKEFLVALAGLTPSRKFWQDYELHLKAIIRTNSYEKFFNLPPDVYIRNGDPSSLSRSTPFAGDLNILIARIKFLEEIEIFTESLGKKFSCEEWHSFVSFKYYLILQLWIRHGKYKLFKIRWKDLCYKYKFPFSWILFGYFEAFFLKAKNRLSIKETANVISLRIAPNHYLNRNILQRSQIGVHLIN